MARTDDKLRTVRLQVVDELTGEPLEYVNVRTNAKSVSFSDGTFLEDVMKSIKTNLSNVMVSDAKVKQMLQQHLDSNMHAVAEKLANAFIGLDYNKETGIATFTRYDGETFEWDTAMEHIPIEFKLDKKTNELRLITDKNPEGVPIDLSKFVDVFEGEKVDDTTTKVTSENHIIVHINEKGVKRVHLDEDVRGSLLGAEEFIEKYEDKLEGIEENANNYSLPIASESVLGGIKPGFGLKTDETGVTTATNVLMGNTMEDATPCGIFLEVQSIGGASTDPLPVMEEAVSYITSEGDIIEYNQGSALYTYTNASSDGSVENNLPKADVTAKFVNGLELIPLDTITWYTCAEHPTYEYAVSPSGDGFVYNLENSVRTFVGYIDTATFIQMFNGGELTEKTETPKTSTEEDTVVETDPVSP